MTYRTITTNVGRAAIASAEAVGSQIILTHMSVGDGAGNPVDPVQTQTALVRERFRTTINRVFQDPDDHTRFTAEMIIPAGVGGFTMREIAAWTADGDMFSVGNLPETYKPADGEGVYADATIRIVFVVENASVITVVIDPNVAVATQQWVLNNVSALPHGGTTGQALIKNSNADADASWHSLSALNVVVTTIEEDQILAGSQTQVDLALTTTYGLSLYVDGVRLQKTEWTPHSTIATRLMLAAPYAAGSKLTAVQNEPAGDAGTPLLQAQNLADVPDKAAGRTNLGVYSKAETDQKAPAGLIAYYCGASAPVGWLKANGSAISRTTYAALFAVLGTSYGAGDGFTTFNLPDLRGEFLRGWDDGRGVDGGRTRGSVQGDANKAHAHDASSGVAGGHTHTGSTSAVADHAHGGNTNSAPDHNHGNGIFTRLLRPPYVGSLTGSDQANSGSEQAVGAPDSANILPSGAHSHTLSTTPAGSHAHTLSTGIAGDHAHAVSVAVDGASESRPRNVAFLACIKY